jgi:hypothetical protein
MEHLITAVRIMRTGKQEISSLQRYSIFNRIRMRAGAGHHWWFLG